MGDALNSLIIQAYKEKCDEAEYWKHLALTSPIFREHKDWNKEDLQKIIEMMEQWTEEDKHMDGSATMTCDENCELYMKHGYIQECIDDCCELMSCKDVVTDTCQCNFCDIPYTILEDIKCRHVTDLDWWYDEGYYKKDKKYYKRKFEEVLDELNKAYARIAELKYENKELDDENASLLASNIEMLEQMQKLEKKFNLVGELTKYYGAKKC